MSLFCTFTAGRYFLGIPVEQVQEVMRSQTLSPVPLAREEVSGLINLRGQIVTAIDLRRRLKLPEQEACGTPMNVLVATSEGAVSLLVDRIEDVLEVPFDAIEPPPPTLQGELRELIAGACKLKGRLLLLLNTERALDLR